MKILLVSNMYPSKKYPHYGVFVENTEKILLQMPNVRVGRAVMGKCDGKLEKLVAYLTFYCSILLQGIFGGCDVIYAHFISHSALPLRIVKALNRKVKIVLNAHGNDVVADTPRDCKWIELSRRIIPLADYIIVPSQYFQNVMICEFGVRPERITVYPSGGINLQVFRPQDRDCLLKKYGLNADVRYVGYISRIEADKGWDTFLRMAARLCDRQELRFLVVGDGAEKAEFDALAQELHVADSLIRYSLLSQKEIAELFNILDVFCFPTHRKSESLGLVGLEAMACGCTVVASDAGGPSSYMKDGENGYVFSACSDVELADKVCAALSLTAEKAKHLQKGMRETALQYSQETVTPILLNLFEQIHQDLLGSC